MILSLILLLNSSFKPKNVQHMKQQIMVKTVNLQKCVPWVSSTLRFSEWVTEGATLNAASELSLFPSLYHLHRSKCVCVRVALIHVEALDSLKFAKKKHTREVLKSFIFFLLFLWEMFVLSSSSLKEPRG